MGALLVLAFSEILLFLHVPIVSDYFYLLAWWSYIIFADGIIFKTQGRSFLRPDPRLLFSMGSWSITTWLLFELFNLRLQNWHYINLVSNTAVRWTGYTFAYATVLPGLFATYLILKNMGLFTQVRTKKSIRYTPSKLKIFQIIGLLFLILPLVWPKYFFPLVWGGFVLLLEPFNYKSGANSLLADLEKGSLAKPAQLLAAGLLCGFLWEFWNFWATSKWVYTVPLVGNIKLFEMPILGFLGFPPFALECYVIYNFLVKHGLALSWEQDFLQEPAKKNVLAFQILWQIPFWLICYWLIDKYTVYSFK